MKLVPDSVASRLGKLPVVGKVLPFGGSDEDEPHDDSGHSPDTDASESPGPETAEYSVEAAHGDAGDAGVANQADGADAEHDAAEAGDKKEAVAAASADDEGSSKPSDTSTGSDDHDSDKSDSNTDGEDDTNDITAPSIGPNTVIEHTPPEERLDQEKISNTDVLGLDKRREVVGKRYSASPARQLVIYALFIVIVAGIVIGGKALATNLDKPDAKVKDEAPWTNTKRPVHQLDFPQYGKPAS